MLVSDSGVPLPGSPYGWNPYTSRSITASATNSGSCMLTAIAESACVRTRSSSSCGNDGVRTTSAIRSSAKSKLSFRTRMFAYERSVPAPDPSAPPT